MYDFNTETGEVELRQSAVLDHIGVGAACMDFKRKILYCVHESMTQPGYPQGGGGLVYALAIDPSTGGLTELNHTPSYGSLPSHLTLDTSGKFLIVVHHTGNTPITRTTKELSGRLRITLDYDEAAAVLFRLNDDGSIGEPTDIVKHAGGGPRPEQTHPRLHSVIRSPSGRLFAVCDKGSDKLTFFSIRRDTETLEPCGDGYKAPAGSMPRYGVFHPLLPIFYMNHEGAPFVSALRYDEQGSIVHVQSADVLPVGSKFDPTIKQSDIRIDRKGKYLYALTRGVDAVSVFQIDQSTGEIHLIQIARLGGAGPRGCAISPDGCFLIVALTKSQLVEIWAIDHEGRLSPTGRKFTQPSPGTITFFPTLDPDITYIVRGD